MTKLRNLALAALVLTASPLWAIDIVTQKSTNKQILGEISSANKTEVTIKPKTSDAVKIPANDIAAIKWEGEPAKLNIAKGDEERGNFEKALDTYTEAQKEASGKLKTYLDFLIARTMAKRALEEGANFDEAVKKMEAYLKANPDHVGFYESQSFLGQLYSAKGDYPKAQAAFEGLGKAPWKDFQIAAKVAVGRMQLKQNNIDGANKTFEEASSGTAETDAEKARRAEAQVGKAACLVKQSKHEDALKLIDEVIKATSTEEAGTMSFAYVLQGDCYQAQNKMKDAALAYLHVPILFPKEKAAHAEALYHLAKISAQIGQPDRAAEAKEILLESFPNSEWAKKLQADGGAAAASDAAKTN
ncbi:MAG: tetratricopeptide repeat protein [Planctomycetaceae bacterium]